jgi:hypothetical protein
MGMIDVAGLVERVDEMYAEKTSKSTGIFLGCAETPRIAGDEGVVGLFCEWQVCDVEAMGK